MPEGSSDALFQCANCGKDSRESGGFIDGEWYCNDCATFNVPVNDG